MTDNDNQSACQDELALLLDELRRFAANRDAGIHRTCITNLYDAAFHSVPAFLFWPRVETKLLSNLQPALDDALARMMG